MNTHTTQPIKTVTGHFEPPGDKSISHRAIILGSVASGTSRFSNFLNSEDCLRTRDAFRQMGVQIEERDGSVFVHGVGLTGLRQPKQPIDTGNSGTTIRILLGLLAGQSFESSIDGDESLRKRPMKRVTVPLRQMGANLSGREDANFAPITIRGGSLKGIRLESDLASAQVKSAILLAGLQAKGSTSYQEPFLSRDHTERMLQIMGARIERQDTRVTVQKTDRLNPIEFDIPGDISSASFAMVLAAITPKSDVTIRNVGLNPTRIGIVDVLRRMGADLECQERETGGPEPVGDIRVRGSNLKAIKIGRETIPKIIDELPVVMIACALAEGESEIREAGELRVKETDRIHAMVEGMTRIGAQVKELKDGCLIRGVGDFKGGQVSSYGDHRTAMSFVVAGARSSAPITVKDVACIATSYPKFFEDLKGLGAG